jgi:hypothetical protein
MSLLIASRLQGLIKVHTMTFGTNDIDKPEVITPKPILPSLGLAISTYRQLIARHSVGYLAKLTPNHVQPETLRVKKSKRQ